MRIAPVTLAAAVLVLGACAPTGVSTVGQKYPIYKTAYNGYALNDRDVFVIIHGGYGTDQAAFRQSVIDGMQRSRGGSRNTRFTTTPQQNYNSDYKVVMLFNGPITAQADDLCARPEQFAALNPPPPADATHVLAAFCRYDAPLTGVNGTATGLTSTSDPRFASLIRATMTDLFPSVDERPMRDSGGGNDGGGIP